MAGKNAGQLPEGKSKRRPADTDPLLLLHADFGFVDRRIDVLYRLRTMAVEIVLCAF